MVRELLIYNITPHADLDFDPVRQQLKDDGDTLLKGNMAAVVLAVDADPELIAQALEGIVEDLRELPLRTLYSGAEIQSP
jgi:hypothetical protein